MTGVIESLEHAQLRSVPAFDAGDRVRVHFQVVEGTRRRTQVFEGTVIKRQGSGVRETFTVRKQSFGVGVERTFPVHSPKIERIEIASRGDVRRAKLYYLRGRVGRRARVRERQDVVLGTDPRAAETGAGPPDREGAEGSLPEASTTEEDATSTEEDATSTEGDATSTEEDATSTAPSTEDDAPSSPAAAEEGQASDEADTDASPSSS